MNTNIKNFEKIQKYKFFYFQNQNTYKKSKKKAEAGSLITASSDLDWFRGKNRAMKTGQRGQMNFPTLFFPRLSFLSQNCTVVIKLAQH